MHHRDRARSPYSLTFAHKAVPGQATTGCTAAFADFSRDADCTGFFVGHGTFCRPPTSDWTTQERLGTVPEDTVAVRIVVGVATDNPPLNFSALIDDVRFVPEPRRLLLQLSAFAALAVLAGWARASAAPPRSRV